MANAPIDTLLKYAQCQMAAEAFLSDGLEKVMSGFSAGSNAQLA